MKKRKIKNHKKRTFWRKIGGISLSFIIGISVILFYWNKYGTYKLVERLLNWSIGVFFFGAVLGSFVIYLNKKKLNNIKRR